MDYKIIWTPRSLENLQHIISVIAAENPAAATHFGEKLLHKIQLLQNFPRLAPVFSELAQAEIKDYAVSPYRVIYRVNDRARLVEILTIWHGARDEPKP